MNTRSEPAGHIIDIDDDDLFEVRRRRVLAFLADYFIIIVLCLIAGLAIGILGVITLGAAWLLYAILGPAVALTYVALTMGGPKKATIGMQLFSLKIVTLDGKEFDWLMAVVHTVLFWVAHVTFTPLMLAVSMFSTKKRLIQDVLLGTVIIRSDTDKY